jgi:hypothetical protein
MRSREFASPSLELNDQAISSLLKPSDANKIIFGTLDLEIRRRILGRTSVQLGGFHGRQANQKWAGSWHGEPSASKMPHRKAFSKPENT